MADTVVLPQAPARGRTYVRPRGRGARRRERFDLIAAALDQAREHDLDVYARMLLVVLARRADGPTGVAQATREALAEDVGASVRKIASTIDVLVEAGLVEVVNYVRPKGARTPGFGANIYRLTFARSAPRAHLVGGEPRAGEGVHDVHGHKEGTTCTPYQPPEEAAIAASSSVIDQQLLREAQRRLGAPIDASLQELLGQRLAEDEARAMYAVEVASDKRNPGGYLRTCLKADAWGTVGQPPAGRQAKDDPPVEAIEPPMFICVPDVEEAVAALIGTGVPAWQVYEAQRALRSSSLLREIVEEDLPTVENDVERFSHYASPGMDVIVDHFPDLTGKHYPTLADALDVANDGWDTNYAKAAAIFIKHLPRVWDFLKAEWQNLEDEIWREVRESTATQAAEEEERQRAASSAWLARLRAGDYSTGSVSAAA